MASNSWEKKGEGAAGFIFFNQEQGYPIRVFANKGSANSSLGL